MTRSTASLTMELGSNVRCKRRIGHVEEREQCHLGHVADHLLEDPAVRGHDQVPQGLHGPRPEDIHSGFLHLAAMDLRYINVCMYIYI